MTTDIERASARFMAVANRLPTIAPLYALGDQFNQLIDLLADPESDPAVIEAQLVEVTRDIKAKAFGIAEVIRSFERRAEDYKREQDRLYAERKVLERAVEQLRAYTLEQMAAMGLARIDAGVHTLRVQANPHSVEVLDAAAVPSEYQRTKIEISVDKVGILAAFKKDGEVVPGTQVVRTESLRIS